MLIMMLSVLRATHINHCQIGLTLVPAGSQKHHQKITLTT